MNSHSHSHTALLVGARLAQALHLAVVIHAVKFENRKLYAFVNVLDLLGLGVRLLLALLTPTAKTKHLMLNINTCEKFCIGEAGVPQPDNPFKSGYHRTTTNGVFTQASFM